MLKKVALTTEALQAQIDLLRGAVTIAYPGGLPAHETIPGMIEGKEELEGAAVRGCARGARPGVCHTSLTSPERVRWARSLAVARLAGPGDGDVVVGWQGVLP